MEGFWSQLPCAQRRREGAMKLIQCYNCFFLSEGGNGKGSCSFAFLTRHGHGRCYWCTTSIVEGAQRLHFYVHLCLRVMMRLGLPEEWDTHSGTEIKVICPRNRPWNMALSDHSVWQELCEGPEAYSAYFRNSWPSLLVGLCHNPIQAALDW